MSEKAHQNEHKTRQGEPAPQLSQIQEEAHGQTFAIMCPTPQDLSNHRPPNIAAGSAALRMPSMLETVSPPRSGTVARAGGGSVRRGHGVIRDTCRHRRFAYACRGRQRARIARARGGARGNGTTTVSGTPTTSTKTTYKPTLTATKGVGPKASQSFTLNVS